MKIVITGSLGNIGKPLTQLLVQKKHTAIVISSSLQKKEEIEKLGAIAAIGSVDDVSFLKKTFKNTDAVFCMNPPNYMVENQLAYYEHIAKCYAKAIKMTNVKRVIYLSSYGAHLPSGTGFIKGSHVSEKILNAIPDIKLTHIRPTFFYYNLYSFIAMIKTTGTIGAVYGGNDRLAMVSPIDIASAVAEEITENKHIEKIKYVSSDDRSCNEVAHVLGNAIGKTNLEWKTFSKKQAMQALVHNGVSHHVANNLVELGLAIHTGTLREDFDKNNAYTGKVSLENFAKEFAAIYQK